MKQAQTIWLFDLDNTLHNASAAVFPAIAENMTRLMAEFLRDANGPLDLAAVNALKRLKKLTSETSKESLMELAGGWKPYRTIATMLLWHFYLSAPLKTKIVKTI